jgi:RNA polymerase sporulation-specific sigma factor
MIIGEIKRYLRDNNTLRVSRSVRDLAYKSLQIRETLSRKLGREVTVSEIVNVLTESGENRSEEEVEYALEAISPPVSIFDPVYGEGNDAVFVMDQLPDDNDGEEIWLESICLKEAMKKLSQREKTILGMRFYNGKTQMEVADEIGISQAQVSRLEKGAIERIKKQM